MKLKYVNKNIKIIKIIKIIGMEEIKMDVILQNHTLYDEA